jgi:hypothetical protein
MHAAGGNVQPARKERKKEREASAMAWKKRETGGKGGNRG